MKLSEQGLDRLFGDTENCYCDDLINEHVVKFEALREKEWQADDFDNCVVLTVEEACEILYYLSYLHLRGGKDSFLKELEKCNRNLYERIEQTEEGK